jgi:hypothetical protein
MDEKPGGLLEYPYQSNVVLVMVLKGKGGKTMMINTLYT